jgi:hypothetical protein
MADHVPHDAHHPIDPFGESVPTLEDVHNHYPAEPGISGKDRDVDPGSVGGRDRVPQPADKKYTGGSKPPIKPFS